MKIKMWHDFRYIIIRNVFLLTNAIIFAVVVMLFVFGETYAGFFIGVVLILNVTLGLLQDIRAWLALARLQLLTAPHVTRVRADGSEESVLTEDIQKDDRLKLKIGDQIPCDGVLLNAQGFEINEGLITGESYSIPKTVGDQLLAGSVVTSGFGVMRVDTVYRESRIARMTEGIQQYSVSASPIQQSIERVITYTGYVLVAALVFVISRGIIMHIPSVRVVMNIGALASMLVPQGLVFAATLLFAYGAANLYRKNVLLQEVNATEKLGRIKNLCMDKTGTLTENTLAVEAMHVRAGTAREDAEKLAAAYSAGTGDSSETFRAVKKFITREYSGTVSDALAFSSWRQFGAVRARDAHGDVVVFAGSPDVFLPHIGSAEEQQWLRELLAEHSPAGKHVLCMTQARATAIPRELTDATLSIVAVFVFYNNLREGIRDTINFFQDRGVRIRIISGDNPETARAIAAAAGIAHADKVIIGKEMEHWSAADYETKVKLYTIFARIVPEVKEKIVEAFKKDGFTAMVGDGANDALAIKKADLGIAMFDGAPATRRLAAVVLTNNSFAALPGGVELADCIIRNVEIFSSIFFSQTFVGFFLFIIVSALGREYPLTPLNITLINYFVIGIPGLLISYWAIRPEKKAVPVSAEPFLNRVVPFSFTSAIVQTVGMVSVFALGLRYSKTSELSTLLVFAFIPLGVMFFMVAPRVYNGFVTRAQKIQFVALGIVELIFLISIFSISPLVNFFNVTRISWVSIIRIVPIIAACGIVQYILARWFTKTQLEGEQR
jgi:cation-transporting ATPase E